jgi:hypothetical protein
MSIRHFWRFGMLLMVVALLSTACGLVPGTAPLATPASNAPPASAYLPTLPGYSRLEASTIQAFIAGLGETGSVLLGQFQATAAIAAVDSVVGCYQDVGAVAAGGYSKDALPIVAGVVAVANRTLLLNPQTFLACISGAQPRQALADGQGGGGLQPCAASYTTVINGETFDFLYAGTDLEICQAFCRSLPSCTAHQ